LFFFFYIIRFVKTHPPQSGLISRKFTGTPSDVATFIMVDPAMLAGKESTAIAALMPAHADRAEFSVMTPRNRLFDHKSVQKAIALRPKV